VWSRSPSVVWGGILVILGVLFLLSNLDINIRWDVIWPVFIIAVGVWLIAARIGPGGNYADVDSAEPRDGLSQATLDLSLGAGTVGVRSGAQDDQLYKVHLEHAGSSPEVKLDRSTGTLKISSRFDWFMGARRFRLDAQISDALPWTVKCATGAIRGDFDLATTQLTAFDCRTGASRITVNLPAPKGVVPVRIDGGALRVDLVRPSGAAMKVSSTGGALQLRADGTHQDGFGNREWRSTGFDAASDRYEVTVSGGALNVNISTR
jgi:cell wall-active antibiotic response 4TMS protein YvqF